MINPKSRHNRIIYQNQIKMYVFSLTMFSGKMQRESCFCIEPDAPYLWKIHFVMRGKTNTIGSIRCSCGVSAKCMTRRPYDMNSPSKNRFIKYICTIMLMMHRNSQNQYRIAYNLWRCNENHS